MVTIDDYAIDIAKVIEHASQAEVTAFPVEEGADITDNVRILPDAVTIEGTVSDTPIAPVATIRALSTQIPSEEARDKMRSILAARLPVKVITLNRVYRQVVMESLSETENAQSGKAYQFRATFREIRIVTNERSTVRVAVPRNAKKVKRGAVPTETVETVQPRAVEGASALLKTSGQTHWTLSAIPGQ